jgi:hypothetical protein
MNAIAQVPSAEKLNPNRKLGFAWVLLCAVFALHVLDEASTGFLAVYNPTVDALRERLGYWPMPNFEFRGWLTGLIVAVVVLFACSAFVFGGQRWIRPLFYFFAVVMLLNGLGHSYFTILGHTVSSVRFPRPAPGFYSSPFLLATSVYALIQLWRTRRVSLSG